MFHDPLALFKEHAPLSTTSIVASNISFVHMPLLVFEGIRFSCVANLLFRGLRVGGRFSLLIARFVSCKSNMLLHHLQRTIEFMIACLFMGRNV